LIIPALPELIDETMIARVGMASRPVEEEVVKVKVKGRGGKNEESKLEKAEASELSSKD
jgi:hypothetical protein